MVDFPSIVQQQNVNPSVTVSLSYGGDFLDSHSQKGLLVLSLLLPMPYLIDSQYRITYALTSLKAFLQIAHGIPLLGRPWIFCQYILQHQLVEAQTRYQLFQLRVFFFKLPEPLHIARQHAAMLALPEEVIKALIDSEYEYFESTHSPDEMRLWNKDTYGEFPEPNDDGILEAFGYDFLTYNK